MDGDRSALRIPEESEGALRDQERDGRHARRDRNRLAVLEAAIDLFFEGDPQPRPEQIAERAGVSLRSLYRYYADIPELYRAAMDHNFERAAPVILIPQIGEGPLEDRIARCVTTRLKLYEVLGPSMPMARIASQHNEMVRVRFDSGRDLLRSQVEKHFQPELDALPAAKRSSVLAAADVICQLETLYYLRAERKLSSKAVAQVMTTALSAIFSR